MRCARGSLRLARRAKGSSAELCRQRATANRGTNLGTNSDGGSAGICSGIEIIIAARIGEIAMTRVVKRSIAAAVALVLLGCAPSPESPRGFSLPPGDIAAGRQAFIDLRCHGCHRINSVELPQFLGTAPVANVLGGESVRVRTYGELVTSIINPSHRLITGFPSEQVSRDGQSIMPVLNGVMTVQQLVDLVALLQSSYAIVTPADESYAYRYEY